MDRALRRIYYLLRAANGYAQKLRPDGQVYYYSYLPDRSAASRIGALLDMRGGFNYKLLSEEIRPEQIAGLEMMGVDPVERILAPRFLGGLLAMPLLAAIFSSVGVLGGWFVGVSLLGVDDGAFWGQMSSRIDLYEDVLNGVAKSLVFGFVVTWIALFQGYDAVPTSEGVSRATTRSVVHSALAVLALDFVLTALMFGD